VHAKEDSTREDRDTIELEVVRIDGRRNNQRPLFLDARRFIRICHWIEQGESASEACRREFVTYQIFRKRVGQFPEYQHRLKQAEEIREHFLREFHIANVTRHSVKSVLASLWWLERRYPNEFALKIVNRDSGDMEQLALCDKISLEQLVANANLAAEIAANPPSGLAQASKLTDGISDHARAAD
jgi:hypothetical protein